MARISTRYAPHIAVLCTIVLIPVMVHSYVGLRGDDCAHPEAFISPAFAAAQPAERQETMKSLFAADQWREGQISLGPDGAMLEYAVIRSWEPKRVYYRPEYRMFSAATPDGHSIEWSDLDGERIPIHRPQYRQRMPGDPLPLAAYLLLFDAQPVENPYLTQLATAPLQMLRGSRPMTLMLIWGSVPIERYEAAERRAETWILESLQSYRAVCRR